MTGTALGGLVFMFHGIVGYEETFCVSKTYNGGFSNAPCVISGFLFYVSLTSSTAWATAIIFDVWYAPPDRG